MRNLKRTLSLVLAMVMLFGMMVIPTGAASNFADADEIVNKEAVEITAGMGLFAGSDGKFNPKGNVTRAQMATIIVKMLRGSDFNADAFKGAGNPFTDTAAFEGGWAEGYVNACYQMGIVKGYGDGTFKPGNSVTTAEAVTMIINALKVDAGQGEWPLTVMAKASEMKLFGDLSPAPATSDALIRDQLAVIVLEGLQYSPKGASGYKVDGVSFVFDNMADALKAAGYDISLVTEVVGEDTLANSVYSMGVATGFLTGNQSTGEDYTVVGTEDFNVETGLDLIGHYVSVYYQMPEQGKTVEAYEVYAVIDESTVVIAAEDLDSAKEYKAAFGKNYDMNADANGALDVLVFDGEYNMVPAAEGNVPYIPGQSAPKGTYIIYQNKVVAFLRPGVSYASQIIAITDFDGEKTYTLDGVDNPLDAEDITLYLGAAKGDYVTYTIAGGQYVLSPVDPVKGTVSRTTTNSDGDTVLTVGGTEYVLFNADRNDTDLDKAISGLTYSTEQYTFYVTQDGEIVGWAGADGSSSSDVDVDNIVYALGTFALESNDGNYGMKVKKYYLQGVNTAGEEAHVLVAIEYDTDKDGVFAEEGDDEATLGTVPALGTAQREGFYLLSDPADKDAKKEGVKEFARIGVKDERNDATGNLFYGWNRYGSTSENTISWPASYANNHVCTTACAAESAEGMTGGASNHSGSGDDNTSNKATRTFFGSDVRYLMIDGDLGEALETDAGGSDFKWTLPSGEAMKHPILYKLNDVGATEIVMCVIKKDPDELNTTTSTIFVVSNESVGSSADGDLYEYYIADSGTKGEAVLKGTDGTSAPAVGFWRYMVEDDGTWRQTTKITDDETLGYTTGTLTELYFVGLFDGKNVSATFADGSSVPYITGASATNAKIVDLRTQDEKDASGISTITTVEQLDNLADTGKLISMYVWNKSKTATGVIYVKSVVNNPTGVIYVTDPTTGAAVTLDGKFTSVAVSAGGLVGGFGRIETAQGTISLTPVTGSKYRTNELIVGVDGSTVSTTALDTGVAKSLKITDSTTIADTTSLNIDSLAELEAALDAGKMMTIAVAGEDGANASLVVITGQGDPYLANGDQVYVKAPAAGSVTADVISGTKAGEEYTFTVASVVYPTGIDKTKAEKSKGYYTITKSDSGDITLTFSYNIVPAVGDAFYIQEHVEKGSTVYALVVSNGNGLTAGTWGYVEFSANGSYGDSSFGSTQSTSRFWIMHTDSVMWRFKGVWQTAAQGGAYKFAYHDIIDSLTADTLKVKHGHGTCSSSDWAHADGCASGQTRYREVYATLAIDSSLTIVDLTGNNITTLAAAKTLIDEGEALINIYSADGTSSSATATTVIVIPMDPADVVLP